jgi:hypothetical protein
MPLRKSAPEEAAFSFTPQGMIEVARPDAPDERRERRDVLMHLRVWEVTHSDAQVELL